MTATYYCSRKAEDLRIGNLFVDWAIRKGKGEEVVYGLPTRITNIKVTDHVTDELRVDLQDGRKFRFMPQMEVVVMEFA